MAKFNKQLTLSVLKKLDNKFNQQRIITLSNGYELSLDLHFRNSIIEEVFNKLTEIYKITQEDKSLNNFPLDKYALLLLILNFTSLRNIKINSIEEELQVMRILVDQDENGEKDLFKEIIEKIEIEVPEELKKFNTKIFKIMEEKIESLKQQQKFYEILSEEIDKQKLEIEQVEQKQEGDDVASLSTKPIEGTTEKTSTED